MAKAKTKTKKKDNIDIDLYVGTEYLSKLLKTCMGAGLGDEWTLGSLMKELNQAPNELRRLMKYLDATGETTVSELVEAIEARSGDLREAGREQKVVGFIVNNPQVTDRDIVDFADEIGIAYPVPIKKLRAEAKRMAPSNGRKAPKKG